MKTDNPKDILRWAKQQYNTRVQELVIGVDGAMADSADEMEKTISTVESSLVPGKIGRVHTGHMIDSVGYEELEPAGKNKWKGSFGWTEDQENYFKSQEYGTGTKAGVPRDIKNISPMHALTGALIRFKERIKVWR